MTKLISKFIRICREGVTTDGRTITHQQIDEMASNYNPAIYGARIWLEHFRSLLPDSIFSALGDVVALKAEDDGEGKRVLLAQLSPSPRLLQINKERQKVFTSIEMDPNFSNTGEAYLVGLAITDSPASLGTEMLQFSQKHRSELKTGSNLPETVFSEPVELDDINLSKESIPPEEKPRLITRIKEMLSGQQKNQDQALQDMESGLLAIAESQQELQSQLNDISNKESQSDIKTLESTIELLKTQVAELSSQLSKQPDSNQPQRPAATGTAKSILTDC